MILAWGLCGLEAMWSGGYVDLERCDLGTMWSGEYLGTMWPRDYVN